jgi:hypothetical protein
LRRGARLDLIALLLGAGELPQEDNREQKDGHEQGRPEGHQVLTKRPIALLHHRSRIDRIEPS